MTKKTFPIFLPFVALVLPLVVLLMPNKTFGALPIAGATLGQSCSFNLDCQQPLLSCIDGTCSICGPYLPCASGSSCTNGVCQKSGGNEAQEPCTVNSNCKEPLVCGANKVCQSVEHPTPTPSATLNPGNGGGLPSENDWMGVDITIQDVEAIIIGIACWMMRVAGALMVIFLTWSGILYMYAQGDTTKLKTAKEAFQKTLWGVLIILGVYVIIATVANAVGLQNFSFIPLAC